MNENLSEQKINKCNNKTKVLCLTLFVALLLVFSPLARLILICVAVDGIIYRLSHLLLPALGDHQRKVLIELLITVKQLRERHKDDNYFKFRQPLHV